METMMLKPMVEPMMIKLSSVLEQKVAMMVLSGISQPGRTYNSSVGFKFIEAGKPT
jgi:hypothetical protein